MDILSGSSHIVEPNAGAVEIKWIRYSHGGVVQTLYVFDDSVHKDHDGWGKVIFQGTIKELIDQLKWEGVTA